MLERYVAARLSRGTRLDLASHSGKIDEVAGWQLDITGGAKAERGKAMQWARKFAEGWLHKPTK